MSLQWAQPQYGAPTCRRKVDLPHPLRPAISKICPGRTAVRKNTPVGAGSVYVRAKSSRAVSSGVANWARLAISNQHQQEGIHLTLSVGSSLIDASN